MGRLLIFFLFVHGVSTAGLALGAEERPEFKDCCVCIHGETDVFRKICRIWVAREKNLGHCERSSILSLYNDPYEIDPKVSCDRLAIFGSFHGAPSFTDEPFRISQKLAETYRASELVYDGVSCQEFSDLTRLRALARKLAEEHSSRTYRISGNQMDQFQDYSVSKHEPEPTESNSKVTATIRGGDSELDFDSCSHPGDKCALSFYPENNRAGFDPNSKTCALHGAEMRQACCQTGWWLTTPKGVGTWATPGESCRD